jgi:hypothetical protein
MTRTPAQVVAAMAAAGRLVAFDDATSWTAALFRSGPDGIPHLSPSGAPDRELLAALTKEYAALDEHAATLPERMRRLWLEDVLGIDRLPAVPDCIVAHATVDPKVAPAVLPKGTLLRGGKDAFGNERRYVTLDALTAHGAPLVGVRSLAPGGTGTGQNGVVARAPDFPLRPAGSVEDAPHSLRIHSAALRFEGGDLTAVISFTGASSASGLAGATWRYSRSDGSVGETTGVVSGSSVTVNLTSGCGVPDGGTPWIECVIGPNTPVPVGFSFTEVTVRVSSRSPFVPQAAFYNDGAVDVTKEFQPFGAVAKRGDAFYIRSDEAFGKKLNTVEISVTIMQEGGAPLTSSAGGSGIPDHTAVFIQQHLTSMKAKLGSAYAGVAGDWQIIHDVTVSAGNPSVHWQRRVAGKWTNFGAPSSRFGCVSASANVAGSPVASEPFAVAGQQGHYVRAFLAQGDFGWTDYQRKIADFATQAVAKSATTPTMPQLPVPPIASAITVRYTTSPVQAVHIESLSGWRRQVKGSGAFTPFRLDVAENGWGAMVALGLELPGSALGSSVSLWFDVDSPSPCGSADEVQAEWQYWTGSTWATLAVADGSRQLRESGLLRFVAPQDWAEGSLEVDSQTGRWIRLIAEDASRLGDVRDVVVDAVVAEFVSAAADPATDPSSIDALPPSTIKGTLTPIIGVKKVTNLASIRGRVPETDADYLVRASARARHRERVVSPWDYEQHVVLAFPEVAAVLCLPHTDRDGNPAPGSVGLVVVPAQPLDRAPRPSVSLAGRIIGAITPLGAIGTSAVVLCAAYVPVTVMATIRLRPGIAALTGKEQIAAALETFLHPTGTTPVRWGRTLYASAVIAFLERHPSVDVVESFELHDGTGAAIEMVEVDVCRGLYCSSAQHALTCEEQL